MKYYLIAGEASGDLHGSNLIKGLRAEDPSAEFRFWGGEKMLSAATAPLLRDIPSGGKSLPADGWAPPIHEAMGGHTSGGDIPQEGRIGSPGAAGVAATAADKGAMPSNGGPECRASARPAEGGMEQRGIGSPGAAGVAATAADKGAEPPQNMALPPQLIHDYKDGAVMGLGDVLAKAGKILGNIAECKRDILSWAPDVVILIDYPGFNMKIARFCHRKGIRVFYYIAPKTWASRENRNRKLKAWVDRMFIVFPFEIPYFESKGIPYIYKGNPLIDAIDAPDPTPIPQGRYIAILAGSRKGEISRMMPICMKVADTLIRKKGWENTRFIVAGAPSRNISDYSPFIGDREYVEVRFSETYAILRGAQAAIINSGTASLEAALIGTPQVVCWSTGKMTAFIARKILRVMDHVRFISLANLIIDREAFRELIQEDFTPEAVSQETARLVEDIPYRMRMLSDYTEIRNALGGSGASRAVAAEMINCLNGKA